MNIIEDKFSKVNLLINSCLESNVALINQLANYIVMAGGKRLRPKLVLLAAQLCCYSGDNDIKLAAIIEFIHTATLLHDDVVDESHLRRGRNTANEVFGNQAAVLTGDFLYSRSFQMMVEIGNMKVMKILSDTTNVIAEGEVMQLMHSHDSEITEKMYMEVIYRKTARLFESATELGAVIAEADASAIEALRNFGKHLGNAFQIIDDIIDYKSDRSDMGKNSGDDLAEGKVTLPLIQAMKSCNNNEKSLIVKAIANANKENFNAITKIVHKTKSFEYCLHKARCEIEHALHSIELFDDSSYKNQLVDIARSSITRTY